MHISGRCGSVCLGHGSCIARTRPPCCYVCTLLRKADSGLFLGLMLLKHTVDWEIFAVKNVSIGAPK